MTRPSGRSADQLRDIQLNAGFSPHAEGSCLVQFGATHVHCTASVETRVPPWLKGKGQGWVTAEYGMLPRSTGSRMNREAARGKQSGRTQEIQRLIGRSLRAVVNLEAMPDIQIVMDCDVIQADGGTRTAAITGAYVALVQACDHLLRIEAITENPIREAVAAISCGIYEGIPVLDLDYAEDSGAHTDANFVMTGKGQIVEIQATAEENAFSKEEFQQLYALAEKGIGALVTLQKEALKK